MIEEVDEGIVNCEVKLVAALEDINELRKMIKKQAKENCQERKAAQLSMSRQLNDKEKVCNTQKDEIDSLKEEIARLSMCQNLVAKYEGSIEQNKREILELKLENHSLKNQLQKYQEECQGLIRQIGNNLEEDLRRKINMEVEIFQ